MCEGPGPIGSGPFAFRRPAGFVVSCRQMDDMTHEQARAEAVRRWGATGTVEFHPPRVDGRSRGRLARYTCVVGNGAAHFRSIEGQGETWRAAFADARSR